MDYVLITAARNEEHYIERTINSVLAQTILPKRWIIVSDNSTDQTDQIVAKYLETHKFIKLIHRESINRSGFASKVQALNLGYEAVKALSYDFIGHLDADISFGKEYYKKLIEKFCQNPALGLAGGFIFEKRKGQFQSRPFNSRNSVAGSIQFFRRTCYEAIGGFIPLEVGGEDWYAEVMARMKGWVVEAFPELKVFHHKPSRAVRGLLKENIRKGLMDFSLGSHPLFEIGKCIHRLKESPFLVAAFIRMVGFLWCYCSNQKRYVPVEFIEFLRAEQLERIKLIILNKLNVWSLTSKSLKYRRFFKWR